MNFVRVSEERNVFVDPARVEWFGDSLYMEGLTEICCGGKIITTELSISEIVNRLRAKDEHK